MAEIVRIQFRGGIEVEIPANDAEWLADELKRSSLGSGAYRDAAQQIEDALAGRQSAPIQLDEEDRTAAQCVLEVHSKFLHEPMHRLWHEIRAEIDEDRREQERRG